MTTSAPTATSTSWSSSGPSTRRACCTWLRWSLSSKKPSAGRSSSARLTTSAPTSATRSPPPPGRSLQPGDRIRLRHLREAATKAISYSEGKQRIDLDDDELLRLALTRLVEIVGEAAKSISITGRASLPDVPGAPPPACATASSTTTSTSTSTSCGRRSLRTYPRCSGRSPPRTSWTGEQPAEPWSCGEWTGG